MRCIPIVSAALSVLLTPALSTPLSNPLQFLSSFPSLSQASGVNFTFNATERSLTKVRAGSLNNTLTVIYSFDIAYTALIGSECISCGLGNYNSTKSLEDGYLEYVAKETSVMEVSDVLDNSYKVYFHGKWALETLNLMSDDASNKTFGKTEKHKVFIIEKIEQDVGSNISLRLSVDGVIGLAKNSKYESYAEYLKRRKLISSNTLSIENHGEVLDSNYYKFTYGIFNKTAISANLN
jgi:hypothetical protein